MPPPRVQPDVAPADPAPTEAPSGNGVKDSPTEAALLTIAGAIDLVGLPASKRILRSQGRRTMRRLLDAAMIAFDQRGYHDTRVNDVVKIAKTSHGTFYLYFSNKEDVLRALFTEAGNDARELAEVLGRPPVAGGTPQWADVRVWVSTYSDLWRRYGALFRAWTDLARIDPDLSEMLRQTFALMADALIAHLDPATQSPDLDPQVAAMAVLSMLDRFHAMREFARQPIDDAALDTLATMVFRALFDDGTGRGARGRPV